MPGEVLVRGEGQARCLPDRATVSVTLVSDGETAEVAYADASRTAADVDAVFGTFAAALERQLTAGVLVSRRTRWHEGEESTIGWRATRTSVVDVRDMAALGTLIAKLATAGAAVNGPAWVIDPANPAHQEARRAAILDARERAVAYASALRMQLGDVSWIAEPGLRGQASPGAPVAHLMRRSASAAAGAEPVMEVSADEMTVRAVVEACFALSTSSAPAGARQPPDG